MPSQPAGDGRGTAEPGDPGRPDGEARRREWQRKVLYHHRARTDLGNQRKYLGWIRVSLGLITLGFVVERLDLFLARAVGVPPPEGSQVLFWAPMAIFCAGSLTIAAATWEFLIDRKRIATETKRGSGAMLVLVALTLVTVLLIAILLLSVRPDVADASSRGVRETSPGRQPG